LDENLKKFYPEGGGGGQSRETYELVAYYYLKKVQLTGLTSDLKPLFFIIGDEGFYPEVNRGQIMQFIGTEDVPQADVNSYEMFKELMKIYDVYILRIPHFDGAKEKRIEKDDRLEVLVDQLIQQADEPLYAIIEKTKSRTPEP